MDEEQVRAIVRDEVGNIIAEATKKVFEESQQVMSSIASLLGGAL